MTPEKKRRVWEVLRISDIKDIKYIKIPRSDIKAVSYTHLTLPTILLV